MYVGNLTEECDEAILWELFAQVGRVVRVSMPRDKVLQRHQNYGFASPPRSLNMIPYPAHFYGARTAPVAKHGSHLSKVELTSFSHLLKGRNVAAARLPN